MDRVASRRQQAEQLLNAMSDSDLCDVVLAQQQATWRRPDLVGHHRAHSDEWTELLGEPALSLEEYAAIGPCIAASWDRIVLSIETGGPTWLFVKVSAVDDDVGLVAAMRHGRIRTTLVAGRLALWVQRQIRDHGAIEVTDRVRSARQENQGI